MVRQLRAPIVGRYQLLHPIASSSESRVFLAEDLRRGGSRCALKVFRVDAPGAFEAAASVFAVLRNLRHPGVVEVYDFGRVDPVELEAAGGRWPAPDPGGLSLPARRWPTTGLRPTDARPAGTLAYVVSAYHQGLGLRDAFVLLFGAATGGRPADASTAPASPPSPIDPGHRTVPQDPTAEGRTPALMPAATRWRIFLEAVARIAEALDAVHSAGLIHFDVKVENILLVPQPTASSPERFDVKLLDFGLAEKATTPVGTRVRGTIPFLAPELVEASTADQRSDLFSLGVTLAAAISGRFPFPGAGPREWLAAARAGTRSRGRDLHPEMPEELARLIDRLLDPDPTRRPQDAASLIPILERAGGFDLLCLPRQPSPFLPVVGWEREIARLRADIEAMKRGEAETSLIILEGDADCYLDRLADEVVATSHLEGVRVESARARSPRSFAYQPFGEIACRLVRQGHVPRKRIARYLPAISLFCPGPPSEPAGDRGEEGRFLPAPLPALKLRLEILRMLDLATEFFLEFARECPIVIFVRDLHRAGKETLDLVRSLARNIHLRGRGRRQGDGDDAVDPARLLVVATVRHDEAVDDDDEAAAANLALIEELAAEPYVARVPIRNLTLDEIPLWLRERAPDLQVGGEDLRRLHEKSAGVPAFLDELVRRIRPDPAFPPDPDAPRDSATRVAKPGDLSTAVSHVLLALPRRAVEATFERFQRLPPEEREILETLAAAGGSLLLEDLEDLENPEGPENPEGLENPEGPGATDGARAATDATASAGGNASRRPKALRAGIEGLWARGFLTVREGGPHARTALSPPGLASAIVRSMTEARRRGLHLRIAERLAVKLARESPARIPEDVAMHALRAGRRSLFVEQALVAAERLRAAHAPEAAAQLYERILDRLGSEGSALEGGRAAEGKVGPSDPVEPARAEGLRVRINQELAEIYRELGQLSKALEKLTVLSSDQDSLRDPVRLGSVYRRMGEVFHQSGEPANAAYFLEKSLGLLQQTAAPPAAPVSPAAPVPLEPPYEPPYAPRSEPRSEPSLETEHGPPPAVPADWAGTEKQERGRREYLLTLLALARFHAAKDNLDEAERGARLCLELARGRGEIRSEALLILAEIQQRRGLHPEGMESRLQAMAMARETGDPALLLEVLRTAGSSCLAEGHYDRAIECFEEGLAAARSLESKYDMANCLRSLGTIYHDRADHEKALEHFDRSLSLSSQIGDLRGIARSYNNLGIVHRLKDDLPRAEDCYRLAIDLFGRTNDQHGMAAAMNNLASILELRGRYEEALEYSFRALDKRKKARSRSGMAFSYYRIGKIYQSKGEIERAIGFAEKSIQVRREIGEKLGMAYSELLLGELSLAQEKYADALELCRRALGDFESLENEVGCLMARCALATTCLEIGEVEEARSGLEDVLEGARRSGQQGLVGASLLALGRLATEAGDQRQAADRLGEAERLFRAGQSRRELAATLLAEAAFELDALAPERAGDLLEEAYALLEELGARDLVPRYFFLRGRLELESSSGDTDSAKGFLERGLVEARETNLPGLRAGFQHQLGLLEARRGDAGMATIHLQEARKILEEVVRSLPATLRKAFYRRREREAIRSSLPAAGAAGAAGAAARATRSHAGGPAGDGSPAGGVVLPRGSPPLGDQAPRAEEPPIGEGAAIEEESPLGEEAGEDSWPGGRVPRESDGSVGDDADLRRRPRTPPRGHRSGDILALHRQTMKLHEIAAAMGSEPNLKKLLESVMDAVLELVDAERGFLILKGTAGDGKTVTAARNLDREDILSPEQKISDSVARQVLRTGKPMLVLNALGDKRFLTSKSVRDLRLRSLVCVPLRFRGETLGIVYLDNRHRRDAFGPSDLNALQAFADQAAVAVTNARLIDENRRRNSEMQEANRKMESLNVQLRRKVHRRNAQLALARDDLRQRQSQLEDRYRFGNIIGRSETMQEVFYLLEKVSATKIPVLVEGESGTGKELVARAIHFNGSRKNGRFVSESCGALTETLFETELFGHVRGAFTGAVSEKKGLLEIADGGALFFDDVEDLSPSMQQKLLRALEEKQVRRVGGKDLVPVDVRIIAASSKDLAALVREGLFRADLYWRLNGLRIRLPALRDRKEDIPLLVEAFVRQAAARSGDPPRSFHPGAVRALLDHDWPGNVRELRHLVERTLLVVPEPIVRKEDLVFDPPPASRELVPPYRYTALRGAGRPPAALGPLPEGSVPWPEVDSLQAIRDEAEREFLRWCLRECGGNVTAAARRCRISRESLYRLLRKHGIRLDR